jgi:hypothetical protein
MAAARSIYSTNAFYLMLFVHQGFCSIPKENASRPLMSRLWLCRLIFTKQPIPPNRYEPSRLSKASTMTRSALILKLAKQRDA